MGDQGTPRLPLSFRAPRPAPCARHGAHLPILMRAMAPQADQDRHSLNLDFKLI